MHTPPAPLPQPAAALLPRHAALLRDYLRATWSYIGTHATSVVRLVILLVLVPLVALGACLAAPLWLTLGALWQSATGLRPHSAADVAPYLVPRVERGHLTWQHDRSVPMRPNAPSRAAALALALPFGLLIVASAAFIWTAYGHGWPWYALPAYLLLLAGAVSGFGYYVAAHLNRADPVRAIARIADAGRAEIPGELFDLWESTYPHRADTGLYTSAEKRYGPVSREIEAFLLPYREWIVGNPAAVLRTVQGYWATLKDVRPAAAPAVATPQPELLLDFTQVPAAPQQQESVEERYERARAELHQLVGLSAVKQNADGLANLVRLNRLRRQQGLSAAPVGRHLVFTGNPGTGKTTVARLIADIYHAMGLIPTNTLIEVDRAGLVAGYTGQTAIKTQAVIDRAKGGVLFIDEAYALARRGDNDFGHEAIETLLRAMEDHRDDLVVIVAGYHDEMQGFIASNPGLRSRFNHFIHFDDYTPGEMLKITLSMLEQNGYAPSIEAADRIHHTLHARHAQRDHSWANGRDARSLFEAIITRHASRLATIARPSTDALSRVEAADVPTR